MIAVKEKGAARAAGLLRYFTGRPCIRGHISDRYISGGCVECVKNYKHEWRKNNRARHNRRNRKWRLENPELNREVVKKSARKHLKKYPVKRLIRNARARAKKYGRECTLTDEDFHEILKPMTCSVTGMPLSFEDLVGYRRNPWAPSFDRIDRQQGYVQGNVQLVCWIYNQMRSDWPSSLVVFIAKAILEEGLCNEERNF